MPGFVITEPPTVKLPWSLINNKFFLFETQEDSRLMEITRSKVEFWSLFFISFLNIFLELNDEILLKSGRP